MMKYGLSLSLAALALSFPVLASAQESVTFTKKKLGEGEVRTEEGQVSQHIKTAIKVNGNVVQKLDQKIVQHEKTKETVLAVGADGKATKIKVACEKKTQSMEMPGAPKRENASPLVGKTVIVEQKGEDVSVTDGEGAALAAPLQQAALAEYSGKLKDTENKFSKVIPNGPVTVGQVIKVDEKKAKEIFSNGKDDQIKSAVMTLTLTGTRDHNGAKCGVFTVSLTMKAQPNPAMTMTITLKGELLIDVASCWPHSMDMKGPVKLNGQQQTPNGAMVFDGGGTMHMKMNATYGKVG